MKLVANIPNIKQIMSISNLSCGYILINESIILTKKWQHKYTAKKVMDLSNVRMLVNTTSDIVILYKNMQTKILIENSEFDFATELKNKKILMQLENKLIIFSDYVKQVNEAELISKVKLKEYKLAYVLNNYHDHCISILPNNNILIKINNSIKLFSENMEELAFIKNLNIGKIINTIKNNLPTLSVQKNVVLFSKDDIKISLVKSNESSNIHQIDNYFIMVEDIFLKKFYSIKTKKTTQSIAGQR